ncbi:hypothetical protein DB88DRAFT_513537 [Papiliotrema laurentii]|uniref:Uncharacterized protein n=1 Tax=Papiliotrema laurentii TaxID=5418 RepID=A0AAD9CRF5_PAPLA|nr:hypothetical protein DB88DRAFT_513537 [Papiliotrema laurentii]
MSAPLQQQSQNAPPAGVPMFLQKKGLLGQKGAKGLGSIVSPTDNVLSPCSAKLNGAKQRHFQKAKPIGLSSQLSQLAASGAAPSPASKSDKPHAEF